MLAPHGLKDSADRANSWVLMMVDGMQRGILYSEPPPRSMQRSPESLDLNLVHVYKLKSQYVYAYPPGSYVFRVSRLAADLPACSTRSPYIRI
eukprot:SAG31_NODE_138_length_22877_cov_29.540917_12_plen_93_part_00